MSGIEVAGLVLGAPPLVLLAIYNYSRAIKPFKRFRKFSSYVEDLRLELKISSIKFRNVIEILLTTVWSKDVAQEMLKDAGHPRWHSNGAEYLLQENLSPNYDTVIELTRDIARVLEWIVGKLAYSDSSAKGKERVSHFSSLSRIQLMAVLLIIARVLSQARTLGNSHVASAFLDKIKLSLQEGQLERQLKHVDKRINVLRSIFNHSRDLGEADRIYTAQKLRQSRSESDAMGFEVVRHSSTALFDTVKGSCTLHKEHYAHLGLNPTIDDIKVAQISFDLIFGRSVVPSGAGNRSHTFRLFIQSCLKSQEATVVASELVSPRIEQDADSSIAQALAVTSACLATGPRRKRFKSNNAGPDPIEFELDENQKLPDFLIRRKLCVWLTNFVAREPRLHNHCIGCVDRNSRCQLRFHIKDHRPPTSECTTTSLSKLLRDLMKRDSYHRLPLAQKFRFARILASAVMKFQSTPWLVPEKLRSKNILFYGVDPDKSAPENYLADPYISAPISSVNILEAPTESVTHSFVRNQLIFRLSMMLLELALEVPLEILQLKSEKRKGGLEGEKLTAERLLPAVRHRNGARYEAVVRKCLRTYAGEEPLDRCGESLRKSYCSDVVDELRDLEARFRAVDMGDHGREDENDVDQS